MRLVDSILIFIILVVVGCGKGFRSSNDPSLLKLQEIEENNQKQSENKTVSDETKSKIEEIIKNTEDRWVKDIPKKYEDVGDFYRIKGLSGDDEVVLDSFKTENKENAKSINLIRGKLKFSNVISHMDSEKKIARITGEISFDKQDTRSFELEGDIKLPEFFLIMKNPTSSLGQLLKAKASCLNAEGKMPAATASLTADSISEENCAQMRIDFFYKANSNYYTDQLVTKDVVMNEFKSSSQELKEQLEEFELENKKRNENPPVEVIADKDNNGNSKNKDDKSDSKGAVKTEVNKKENKDIKEKETPKESSVTTDDNQNDEDSNNNSLQFNDGGYESGEDIPNLLVPPSIDDIANLYPDAKQEIDAAKKIYLSPKKKLRLLPLLSYSEESVPSAGVVGQGEQGQSNSKEKNNLPAGQTPAKVDKSSGSQPKPSPEKPNEKSPNTANPVKSDKAIDAHRPIDQSWGRVNAGGCYDKNGNITVSCSKVNRKYLVRSTSLLEALEKIGPSLAGFRLRDSAQQTHFGTYDLVDIIVNLGAWVKQNFPKLDFAVDDMSRKNGGVLGGYNARGRWVGHASHKTGLDVDLSYFVRDPQLMFKRIDRPDGGSKFTNSSFLAAEQWKMIKASFELGPVDVIYMNRNVKNEMCRQALKSGDLKSPKDNTSVAADILKRIKVVDDNHGNHWHLRLDCKVLKLMKIQTKCIYLDQRVNGTECQNVHL